jgi:adenylate cyclase
LGESGIQQRLAAILAADVAGYSRLMARDERGTIAALDAAREVFRRHVAANQGRVVDMAGDSILAVFQLASGAVTAALAVQGDLDKCTAPAPEDQRMRFRIGVHLGEISEKDDGTVYGDGVNVAARLESLADAGGITVSEGVWQAVRGKIAASFEDLGNRAVKNIAQPIHAFRCGPARSRKSPAAPASSGAPEIRQHSIAVLAFDNMSGDPEQVHFCDGISEDIITDLSKINGLTVIGRNSAFAYKGKASDLRRVGRELGVRYVLEGSVRRMGKRVRVTAQLVEAETGAHVWANRYDRDLDDTFLVGDEITRDIVETLDVKIARGMDSRIWRRALANVEARETFMRGWSAFGQGTKEGNVLAREAFLDVSRLEPASPMGFAYAGLTYALDVVQGWSKDVLQSLAEARRLGGIALALDGVSPSAHAALGLAALFEGKYEEAMLGAQRTIENRPMCASPRANLAYVQLYSGDYESALHNARSAIEFNPIYPGWYLYLMAAAQHFAGHEDEALGTLERVLVASPRLTFARALRIAVLVGLGRMEEARAEAGLLRRDSPDFDAERFAATQPFRDKAQQDRYVAALRSAGLA